MPAAVRRVLDAARPQLVRTGLLALACHALLELVRVVGVDGWPWTFKTPAFALLFVLGTLVVWLVVGVLHAVVGRFSVTAALALGATTLLAVVDHEKVRFRREPVYPSDLTYARDPGFLAAMAGPTALVVGLLAVATVVAAGLLVARRLGRSRPTSRPLPRSAGLGLRVLVAVGCLLSLAYLGQFNRPGNVARATYDALGADWRPWSQQRNYLGNGFVGGWLYNLPVPDPPAPPGYGRAEMERIAERWTRAAARTAADRTGSLDDVNVVLVLSESFSDPTRLAGLHLDRDPIPFTRSVMGTTTSGRMLAESIGGGTANMEFEALTGMSLSLLPPQDRVPYQSLVPDHDTFPSVVSWMRSQGHRTVAVHPFTTEMYRRREVYRTLGFDAFVHDTTMQRHRRLGHEGYISDASAFAEVRHQIDASRRPVFVNLVTMQNHLPYDDRYDDPDVVTGPDGRRLAETGQYVRGLRHSDDALRGLLQGLRASREKTVVVLYGDHQPGTYPDDVLAANDQRTLHETPFFVWSNVPGAARPQPVTSPSHFVDLALERVDAPLPPYYALLDAVRREVPAMDAGMLLDPEGREVARADLSPRARSVLHDYRLVQHDLAAGHRWSERAMFGG